jgi:hypothetical protein
LKKESANLGSKTDRLVVVRDGPVKIVLGGIHARAIIERLGVAWIKPGDLAKFPDGPVKVSADCGRVAALGVISFGDLNILPEQNVGGNAKDCHTEDRRQLSQDLPCANRHRVLQGQHVTVRLPVIGRDLVRLRTLFCCAQREPVVADRQ